MLPEWFQAAFLFYNHNTFSFQAAKMRALYHFLWWIITPLIPFYLKKRARRQNAYLLHWSERFGQAYPQAIKNAIWIHAVSVGETRAAEPLIKALQQHFPDSPLLITQMTPTGRATAEQLYPKAQCRYLPYDRKKWVHQFFQDHQPRFGIIMETEIWVNLIHAAHEQNIPLFLANARLSESSQRGYQKVLSLIRPAVQTLTECYVQTEEDAKRLHSIGVIAPKVMGNTKYDISVPKQAHELAQQFRQRMGKRKVFIAASTRHLNEQDEAQLILDAWKRHQHDSNALLVIVPRHPERFQAAFEYATKLGFRTQKRSDNQAVQPETQVWIGDSMGELFAYYLAADIAFVGGSLVDTGCQNIIEPISCGKPVLFGFSTYHFQAVCESALATNAAQQINHADELVAVVEDWFRQPEKAQIIAQNAARFIAQHQGASQKIAADVAQYMHHLRLTIY